jgi:chromosomal replication initiation ATPase DnaA
VTRVFISEIQRAVAREHGIDAAVMREPDGIGARARDHVWPRQEAIRLSFMLTEHSCIRIGQMFGNRDHSTVLEASRRAAERRRRDPEVHDRLRRVTLELLRAGL